MSYEYFWYPILFIFGLAIGSFLNVVSLRYLPGQKLLNLKIIGGRSKCSYCAQELTWYELIPLISFIIQKGRCRSCRNQLSFQYPLVELLSGLIFVFVPMSLSSLLSLSMINGQWLMVIFSAIWIFIFLLFLLLSIIDFRHYIIPDSINLSLAVLGIVLIISHLLGVSGQMSAVSGQQSFLGHYSLLFDFWPLSAVSCQLSNVSCQMSTVINHLFAAVFATLFFGAIIVLTRGRAMGWGDFKLAGALGLIFGWPDIIIIVFLSFIIGALFVSPLLIQKKKTMKDVVPFGPFLIVSASLTFFFGFQIIDGYFKLFNIYL